MASVQEMILAAEAERKNSPVAQSLASMIQGYQTAQNNRLANTVKLMEMDKMRQEMEFARQEQERRAKAQAEMRETLRSMQNRGERDAFNNVGVTKDFTGGSKIKRDFTQDADGYLTQKISEVEPESAGFKNLEDRLGAMVDRGELTIQEAYRLKAQGSPSFYKNIDAPSIGEEVVDREFAKEYVESFATGMIADARKNLSQMKGVIDELRSGVAATGPSLGLVPKTIRDIVTPEGADIQDRVEDVVQRSLRPILGAQFTEKEGERLIARAYNPRQKEEVNAKRLERLIRQMDEALQAKQRAGEYFEKNGTLRGFKGVLVRSQSDFDLGDEEEEKQQEQATATKQKATVENDPLGLR